MLSAQVHRTQRLGRVLSSDQFTNIVLILYSFVFQAALSEFHVGFPFLPLCDFFTTD